MTNQDIQKVESELSVRLPDEYRWAVTRRNGPPTDNMWLGALYNRSKDVIERTRWLADLMESYMEPWSATWVAVSEVNGGDVVILDTGKAQAPLLLWNHETHSVEPFPMTVTLMASVNLK